MAALLVDVALRAEGQWDAAVSLPVLTAAAPLLVVMQE